MQTYIIRRFLLLIPTIIMVTMVVFLVVRLMPGDIAQRMMMEHKVMTRGGSQEMTIKILRQRLGLDQPIHVAYVNWMEGVIQGDFGKSLWTERDVIKDVLQRLPVSVELGILAMIIGNVLGLSVGAYAAMRQDSFGDYAGRGFAIFFLSAPGFWLGTMVWVFPSIWWGWSPPIEFISFLDNPIVNLQQMILPALLLGLGMSGWVVRFLRTTMLDVMRQDYVRTAWSKGMKERVVMVRHVMRNAMIPVVTIIAGQLGLLIGGTVIMEQIFSLPGMGRLFLKAAFGRDYPYVTAINLIAGSFMLVVILITDLSYAYLDPRIRYK